MVSVLWSAIADLPPLELTAVVLAIAYLVLAIRESLWCWPCAFLSTAIYVYLYYDVALFSESILNVYYMAMAVYGWFQWRTGRGDSGRLIRRWTVARHAVLILVVGALVPVWGYVMKSQFNAAYPYLDAFTTLFAVTTTFLVARKVLENWLYWIVIDAVAIYLNYMKGLELTAALFALYVVLAMVGLWQWLREYRSYDPALRQVT